MWKSAAHGVAHYNGLQTCGSVWACPVCAAKISERRRIELLGAMDAHKAAGGAVLLLNLTMPHSMGDDLADMLRRQARAVDIVLRGSKAAKRLYASIGCVGTVRAWEVTYGQNGWHPHFHILLFVAAGIDLAAAGAEFSRLWSSGCRLAGLPTPSLERGAVLQDGSKAANYAAKWGLDHEMTKGHTKKSRRGYSPFDLLRAFCFGTHPVGATLKLSESSAARAFSVFAAAFKGRRQLVWSNGLKARYSVEERSDEALALLSDDAAEFLGFLEVEDWRRVVAVEGRGFLLELAAACGWDSVIAYLDELRGGGGP